MDVIIFEKTFFLKSASHLIQAPADLDYEVAFIGRSNAGKSSALNALTGQSKLARISKTPGRTQLLNFFQCSPTQRLVDLPGYGYAKMSHKTQASIEKMLSLYFCDRYSLCGLIWLMDLRHPFMPADQRFFQLLRARPQPMPLHIVLTKSDKLNAGPAQTILLKAEKTLTKEYRPLYAAPISVQLFSAPNRSGLEALKTILQEWMSPPPL